jgi:hypothetical protein
MGIHLVNPELLGPKPPKGSFLLDHYLEIGFVFVLLFIFIANFMN